MTTFFRRRRRFPERTYKGRERVSMLPRWIGNWVMFGGLTYFMGSYLFGIMGFTSSFYDPFRGSVTPTPSAFPTFMVPSGSSVSVTPVPFQASSGGSSDTPHAGGESASSPVVATLPVQPTFTPLPTLTPYPTQIPIVGDLFAVGYSFYWPPFGPPNCHEENWSDNYCKDVTASGERWTDYIGTGVAVPYQWLDQIPLGSIIRVHDNIEMQGDYKVVDICGACIKEEGHIYFDFLDNRQRLAWTVPLMVEVIYRPPIAE